MKHFFKRTIAYFVDSAICYLLVMLLIQWAFLGQIRDQIGITNEWFKNSVNMEIYVLLTISLPVWIYFILMDSRLSTGTFGKRLFKLEVNHIIKRNKITLGRSVIRTILKLMPWEIAHLGIIFPVPMYFEEQPELRFLTILGLALFLIYAFSILLSRKNQALYDSLLKTIVLERSATSHNTR